MNSMVMRFGFGLVLVSTLLWVVGCDRGPKPTGTTQQAKGHEHPDEGPHGGAIGDWDNGRMHVEFTVDHDKQEATVYILDEEVKKAVPIAAESITLKLKEPMKEITLMAKPQGTDPEGKASQFVGKDPALGKVMEFEGTIEAEFGGVPYVAEFKEEAHGHEEKDKK